MASRYWVGGTSTWDTTVGTKWAATSGGVGGQAVPTSADDVFFDANSTGTCTITAGTGVNCQSLDLTGSGAILSQGVNASLAIGGTAAGAGNNAMLLTAGKYTWGGNANIYFQSTNATQQTITCNGVTVPNVIFQGAGGSWKIIGNITCGATGSVTFTAGSVDWNGATGVWGSWLRTSTSTCSLTLGAADITLISGSTWTFTGTTGLTFSGASATIRFNGSVEAFTGGGLAYGTLVITTSTSCTINNTGTFGTITYTPGAVNTSSLILASNVTVSGTFTATGNSLANRALVQTSAAGTAFTLTAGAVSLTNVDFMDTTGAGLAANAAWTGTSLGDCLGNSNITFDTSATQTWQGTTSGSWSNAAKWTSRVPLPQDDVVISSAFSASQTITADMPRLGRNLNFTGTTGNPSMSLSLTGIRTYIFGSVTLVAGLTTVGTNIFTLGGRGSHTITTAGASLFVGFNQIGPGGTYTCQDALSSSPGTFTHSAGSFIANGFNLSFGAFVSQSGLTRALNLAGITITLLNTTSGTAWIAASTGLTLNAATTTFIIAGAQSGSRTFAGAGLSYGTLTYTVAGSSGPLIVTGANTFGTLNIGSGRVLTMPSSTTNTITGSFNATGTVNGYLALPGLASNYVSTPDSAALSITGDIDVMVRLAPASWTPAAVSMIVSKLHTAGQYSYDFYFTSASGKFIFRVSPDGSALTQAVSTVATGFTDGTTHWIRATRAAATGTVTFYTAADSATVPGSWTQLGSTVATTAGNIFDGTNELEIGANVSGTTNFLTANVYRALVYNGIAGTLAFDANFTTKALGANTFTESSSNAATVTINGAVAQAGDGRVLINASTPGTAATISKSSGVVSDDYLTLQDSTVSGGAVWYAGAHSTSISNNTGWLFQKLAATGGGNWSATTTWVGGVVPTAADVAVFDANSGNVTIDSGAVARAIDCNAYLGTLTHTAAVTLTLGDATPGSNSSALRLGSGMTYTLGNASTSVVSFISTSAVVQTVDTAGKSMASVTFNGAGGSWQLASAFTNNGLSAALTLTAGTLDTNGQTVSTNQFASSNSNTRTLKLGATTMTIIGGGIGFGMATATNATLIPGTSTLNFASVATNGSSISYGGATSFNNITFSGSNPPAVNTAITCVNFTRTGPANQTDTLTISGTLTVTGTFTVTGNSTTNRVFVKSATIGTAQTISAAAISVSNVDFMDITAAGAAIPWTGTSMGNALGNSNITFDTAAAQTWQGTSGGNWSDITKWTSRVPLPQDDVIINAAFSASQTITADIPRMGKSIDFTGVSGSPTLYTTGSFGMSSFGSLTLTSNVTLSLSSGYTLYGRSNYTITSAGKTIVPNLAITAPGGTYNLQDNLTDSNAFSVLAGTFNTNNNTITCATITVGSASTTVNLGSSTINLTSTGAVNLLNVGTSGATINAGTSQFIVTNASTNTRTIIGGGKTYNILTYTVAGSAGPLVISGANTFGTLNIGSGRVLTMPSSTTNTITSGFNATGVSNGYVYLPGGAVPGNYISTPDSAALSMTGDLDIRINLAMDNWAPASPQSWVTKVSNISTQASWQFNSGIGNARPYFAMATGGVAWTFNTAANADPTGLVNGQPTWFRVTRSGSTGTITFYQSANGSSWSQIGTTISATSTAMFDSTSPVEIGSNRLGTANLLAGNVYSVDIRNNILDDGSGVQLSANFSTKPFGANSFTESSSNAATVTINGATAQAGDGRVLINSSTPGTAATLAKAIGMVSCDYLTVQDSAAGGGATWYAGAHSVNVSGNSGWVFSGPSAGRGGMLPFFQ